VIDAEDLFNMVCTEAHEGGSASCVDYASPEEVHERFMSEANEDTKISETSKTPNLESFINEHGQQFLGDELCQYLREDVAKDIAAIEAKHQGELDRTYQSYADSTNQRRKEHEEEIRALEVRHAGEVAALRAELESVDAKHRKELQEEGRKLGEATVQAEAFQAERNLLHDENAALLAWKASVMEVDSQWEPMRRFARLRGARLGHSLAEESARIANELESENKSLRAELATKVCRTCLGKGFVFQNGMFNGLPPSSPCPVCQPAKEG
jgi:hypothetical protein